MSLIGSLQGAQTYPAPCDYYSVLPAQQWSKWLAVFGTRREQMAPYYVAGSQKLGTADTVACLSVCLQVLNIIDTQLYGPAQTKLRL